MILPLQELWLTGQATTSTSSSPAPWSSCRLPFSSSCLFAYWTGGHRSAPRDRGSPPGGPGPTWPPAACTRASPQRETKRRRPLPPRSVPPAFERVPCTSDPNTLDEIVCIRTLSPLHLREREPVFLTVGYFVKCC